MSIINTIAYYHVLSIFNDNVIFNISGDNDDSLYTSVNNIAILTNSIDFRKQRVAAR